MREAPVFASPQASAGPYGLYEESLCQPEDFFVTSNIQGFWIHLPSRTRFD
jgi:hypothetical protein